MITAERRKPLQIYKLPASLTLMKKKKTEQKHTETNTRENENLTCSYNP